MNGRWLYRAGSFSAIALGVGYLLIFPVYASVGAPPDDAQAWLDYAAGKTMAWWAILGLSVVTDFLFVPIALALYVALPPVARDAMLLASAFVVLFVVLDLAVTWPNYAVLITLAEDYAAATTDAERAMSLVAAQSASAVVTSGLVGIYSIATLAVGLLIAGVAMLDGPFGRVAAYLAVGAGVLGIVSVAGPFVLSSLSLTVILASVLTTVWAVLIGIRLYGMPSIASA